MQDSIKLVQWSNIKSDNKWLNIQLMNSEL